MTELKGFFDYLQIWLRYLASGVISVLVIGFVDDHGYDFFVGLFTKSPWVIVAIAGTFGLVTYSIHQALFDKWFYHFSLWCYLRRHKYPDLLQEQVKAWLAKAKEPGKTDGQSKIRNMRFGLFNQTYLRRASVTSDIISIQSEMDKKLALLNFIYCTFYSMFIFSMIFFVRFRYIQGRHLDHQAIAANFHFLRIISVFALSIVFLASALALDYRITKREMWAVVNFFQDVPPSTGLANFRLRKDGAGMQAFVMGSFSNWQTMHPMIPVNDTTWELLIDVTPGLIRYKYFLGGIEVMNNSLETATFDPGHNVYMRNIKANVEPTI